MARRRDLGGALAGLGQQLTQFGQLRSARQEDEERLRQQQQAQQQGTVSDLVLKLVPLVQGGMPADQALSLLQSTAPQGAQLPGIDFSQFEPSEAQRIQPLLQRLGTAQFASDVETPETLRLQAQAAGVQPTVATGAVPEIANIRGDVVRDLPSRADNPVIQQLLQAAQAQRKGLPFREGTQQRFEQDLARDVQRSMQMDPIKLRQAIEQARETTKARETAQEPFDIERHKRTLETVRANQAQRVDREPPARNLMKVPSKDEQGNPITLLVNPITGEVKKTVKGATKGGSSKPTNPLVQRALDSLKGGGQGGPQNNDPLGIR